MEFCPFILDIWLQWLNILNVKICTLNIFSGGQWTVDRPVEYSFTPKPQNVAWPCPTRTKKTLGRCCLQHFLFQNLYVTFSVNGAVTELQVIYVISTHTPSNHNRGMCWSSVLDGLFPLACRKGHPSFPKKNVECCLCMGCTLQDRMNFVYRQWLPKCSKASFIESWGIKGQRHSMLVFALEPHVQRFPQILSMFWWYHVLQMHKFIAIVHQKKLFLNCWTICTRSFSQCDQENPCLWRTEPSEDAPLILSHVNIPCYQ